MVVGDKIFVTAAMLSGYRSAGYYYRFDTGPMIVMKISSRCIRYGDGERIFGRVRLRDEGISWARADDERSAAAFRTADALRT